jgi:hypothetical protein
MEVCTTHVCRAHLALAFTHVAVLLALDFPVPVPDFSLSLTSDTIPFPVVLSLALTFLPLPIVLARVWRRLSRARGSRGRHYGTVGKFLGKPGKLVFVAQTESLVGCFKLIERLADVVQLVDLGVDYKQSAGNKKNNNGGGLLFASYSSRCILRAIVSRCASSYACFRVSSSSSKRADPGGTVRFGAGGPPGGGAAVPVG